MEWPTVTKDASIQWDSLKCWPHQCYWTSTLSLKIHWKFCSTSRSLIASNRCSQCMTNKWGEEREEWLRRWLGKGFLEERERRRQRGTINMRVHLVNFIFASHSDCKVIWISNSNKKKVWSHQSRQPVDRHSVSTHITRLWTDPVISLDAIWVSFEFWPELRHT